MTEPGNKGSKQTAVVLYPLNVKSDFDKLCVVYNLVEQARLKHNELGAVARSNWSVYKDKWQSFSKLYHERTKWLLHEQSLLKEAIRIAKYTPEQWKAISLLDDTDAIYKDMYGDKNQLKKLPTKATSTILDEIKTIGLGSLRATSLLDPLEDFSAYTEVDQASDITITPTRITVTTITRAAISYVYYDKSVGHFSGDFEHLNEVYYDAGSPANYARCGMWAITNSVETWVAMLTGERSGLCYQLYQQTTSEWRINLVEGDSGVQYTDYYVCALDKLYYTKVKRDEAVGEFGTLYLYIYDDSDRTNLLDTLELPLHTSKKDYQYIYGLQNFGSFSGAEYLTGYCQNLDLQEVIPRHGFVNFQDPGMV